jgi:hypothetical protein
LKKLIKLNFKFISMPKTISIMDGLNYRKVAKPCSLKSLNQPFVPQPLHSLTDFRIKMGPFSAFTDGFVFHNSFQMTVENATQIRNRLALVVDIVVNPIKEKFRDAMGGLSVDLPFAGTTGLPGFIIDTVIGAIAGPLLFDNIVGSIPGTMGRCGGMAFAGYDFYRSNWPVDPTIKEPPSTGVLGDYIFNRLLDSIGINAFAWLDWFITLHILPIVSKTGNIALGTAIGSLGGVIGAAFGALLGSQVNVFDFGGKKVILDRTVDEWKKTKNKLDLEAACPLGLLFSDSVTPLGDHQVLAIGYEDNGVDNFKLIVWDNRDGNSERIYNLNFSGNELEVDQFKLTFNNSVPTHTDGDGVIKGFFLENYSHIQPPFELRK